MCYYFSFQGLSAIIRLSNSMRKGQKWISSNRWYEQKIKLHYEGFGWIPENVTKENNDTISEKINKPRQVWG